MAAPHRSDLPHAHVLHAQLEGIEPPIWRQVLVRSEASLAELHAVLQAAFGWDDDHLHDFEAGGVRYADGRRDDDAAEAFDTEATVLHVLPRTGRKLRYRYDFGDKWVVVVSTKEIRTLSWTDGEVGLARLLGGQRAAPPEDCGGLGGYDQLCAASLDPNHPGRDEILASFEGEPFDPEGWEREAVAKRVLAARLRGRGRGRGRGDIELVGGPAGGDDPDDESDEWDDDEEDEVDDDVDDDADDDAELADVEPMDLDAARVIHEEFPYDAETDDHLARWLDRDETERALSVEAYHVLGGHEAGADTMAHAMAHAMVETQLALNDPPLTGDTLRRLMHGGVTRHDAVHAIASVHMEAIHAAVRDDQDVDVQAIEKHLRALDPDVWR